MSGNKGYPQSTLPIHLGGALLCAALLAAAWFLGVGPVLTQSNQAHSVVDEAAKAEQDAKLAKGGVERLSAELKRVQAELDKHPVSLERASQINPLLAHLAAWAEGHTLSITRTRAGRARSLAYYDYVPIEVDGEGGYGDLIAFLRTVHAARGDLSVTAFSARRLAAGSRIAFELELAWYVSSEDAGQGLPTASAPTN